MEFQLVCRSASPIFIGKFVAESFGGSSFGYSDRGKAFGLLLEALVSDCSTSDAQSDDIVLDIPSALLVAVLVVPERLQYGLALE